MFINAFITRVVVLLFVWMFSVVTFLYGYKDSKRHLEKSIHNNRDYYELRGAWIATVNNIDWPICNATQKEQEDLLIFYLDLLVAHNMNAVFFQVKPSGGTIYPSSYAPFAEEFTGKEEIKNPYNIDFLEFFINEAHKRNIEVHAWINPFRVATHNDRTRLSSKNFGILYESLNSEGWPVEEDSANRLISYGGRLYLNPGHPASHNYVLNIIHEIIEKYDIDGIHFDDYFYQYKTDGHEWLDVQTCISSKKGKRYNCKNKEGTKWKRGLSAWRRENTNHLVSKIQKKVKSLKSYVKWGISPFGVWRNARKGGVLPWDPLGSDTLAGSTSYDSLCADTRLWYRARGRYVDYLIPQIYWSHNHKFANYNRIVDWWVREGFRKKSVPALYVGHALYKAGAGKNGAWLNTETMARQISYNRMGRRSDIIFGSVFFSIRHFLGSGPYQTNRVGAKMLREVRNRLYRYPSIIPPLKFRKDRKAPPMVESLIAEVAPSHIGQGVRLLWYDPSKWTVDRYGHLTGSSSRYYAIYRLREDGGAEIVGKIQRKPHAQNVEFVDVRSSDTGYREYGVASLDRLHNQSSLRVVRLYIPGT